MKYMIYELVTDRSNKDCENKVKSLTQSSEFKYDEFDTMEEAYKAIKNRGYNYVQYTILPYVYTLAVD